MSNGEWLKSPEITHYQFLQVPPPPTNQMNSENKEVIYADL